MLLNAARVLLRVMSDDIVGKSVRSVDSPVNRLIERCGAPEHTAHGRDLIHFPLADGLIERRGAIEQAAHVRDLIHFPLADGLIERRGALEHTAHVREGIERQS